MIRKEYIWHGITILKYHWGGSHFKHTPPKIATVPFIFEKNFLTYHYQQIKQLIPVTKLLELFGNEVVEEQYFLNDC